MIEGRDKIAQDQTLELIKNKTGMIFQAAIVKDGFFAALDMLQWDNKSSSWILSEIKATSEVKKKKHLPDLAFQANLLKKIGLDISRIQLIHLNKEYVRSGKLALDKLFKIEDVTKNVSDIMSEVSFDMEQAKKYLLAMDKPHGSCPCVYKGRSNHCTMFAHINPDIPNYSIHDISRIGNSKRKLEELIDTGVYALDDIPEDFKLSDKQQNQVLVHKSGRPLMNHIEIKKELNKIQYPIHFIDYETYPCAIPRFNGYSPYHQIPFQYSLHILSSPSAKPEHKEFIYTGSNDPGPEFIESLCKDIGNTGSIVVWSKKFECHINDQLAKRIPSANKFIMDFNSRVYDLEDIFKAQYYMHPDFKGKTSIKNILPVLIPDLSYKDLEIKEGGTASQEWNKIALSQVSKEKGEQIAENLKRYCGLDSYAMYAIWRKVQE